MNKFKMFFKKLGTYIKNTAWIQPILIVVIIFVVLFSLNPITSAIKTGWTKLTTVNKMEKITYEQYIQKVNSQEANDKMVVVFGQNDCESTPIFFKSMNDYLKDGYDESNFKIYYVNLSTKATKVKIDGVKYTQYKDSSLGLVNPTNGSKVDIIAKDYLAQLDDRIDAFNKSFGDSGSSDLTDTATNAIEGSDYTYISTPVVIWYQGGIETRISNTFESSITLNSEGKKATASSFRKFIEDFAKDTNKAENWDESFDLTAFTGKSIKD